MSDFEEILERNNLDYIPYAQADDREYVITIPYNNTTTLSFISSFVGDLANNGFLVEQEFQNGEVYIEAVRSDSEAPEEDLETETSAAFYLLKRWAKRINKALDELEVLVEKDDVREGAYGEDSEVYIMNPEINMDELLKIVDYFDTMGVELDPNWFTRDKIQSVSNNPWLQEQGYSKNETYLSFPVLKNPRYA